MGGGSGGGIPFPSAEETKQQQLQNQMLQMQIQEEMAKRADDTYKASPAYLNAQQAEKTAAGQRDYNKSKATALQTGRSNITNAFNELGQPDMASPYLAAIQADYDKLQYHPGSQATSNQQTLQAGDNNFDEAGYLAANPDVAAAVQRGEVASGRAHYDAIGKTENRMQNVTNVTPGGADWYDDPTGLTTKDYVGDIINQVRTGRKQQSYDQARTTATQRLGSMGLDADISGKLSGLLDQRFQNTFTNAGTSANDYSGAFDPDAILNSVLDQERSATRSGYTTKTRAAFSGVDPNNDFGDTADDSYINDIVGRQYTDAASALERAKSRGSLTDAGYNSGLSYLGDQKNTAMSTAQTLGGAVLDRDRTALTGIKNNALTAAGGWDFGQSFNPNTFLDQYSGKKASLTSGLGGEVSNALAGQNWFNIGDVLTKAGYAQGAQNVKPLQSGFQTPALSALQDERKKSADSGRGLGGTGVF